MTAKFPATSTNPQHTLPQETGCLSVKSDSALHGSGVNNNNLLTVCYTFLSWLQFSTFRVWAQGSGSRLALAGVRCYPPASPLLYILLWSEEPLLCRVRAWPVQLQYHHLKQRMHCGQRPVLSHDSVCHVARRREPRSESPGVSGVLGAPVAQGGVHRWGRAMRGLGGGGRVQEEPGLHAQLLPGGLPCVHASRREGHLIGLRYSPGAGRLPVWVSACTAVATLII